MLVTPFIEVFRVVPDFWKLIVFKLHEAWFIGLCMYLIIPGKAATFGDSAALVQQVENIGGPLLAMLFATSVGRWSDHHDRRWSATLLVLGLQLRVLPVLLLGATNVSIWTYTVLGWLAGPITAQASGHPLLWKIFSDKLPPKYREIGFQLLFTMPTFGSVIILQVFSFLAHRFPDNIRLAVGLFWAVGVGATLLVVWSMGAEVPAWQEAACKEEHTSCLRTAQEAFSIIRRNSKLVALTVALSLFTLPDLAGLYSQGQMEYTILGIGGTGHTSQQIELNEWSMNWPFLIVAVLNILVSVAVHYREPAHIVAILMPLVCVAFAMQALLLWYSGPAWYVFTAFCCYVPSVCFPPLQAIISLEVPHGKIGQVMGGVASCKDFMAFCAPALMLLVLSACNSLSQTSEQLSVAYALVFVGLACLMLLAWPFVLYVASKTKFEKAVVDKSVPLPVSSASSEATEPENVARVQV